MNGPQTPLPEAARLAEGDMIGLAILAALSWRRMLIPGPLEKHGGA